MQKSKYSKYEVNKDNLSDKLTELYNEGKYFNTESKINKPISTRQQKEQNFRQYRESKLEDINFNYPDVNQCVHDFMINDKKIQEKVASIKKKSFFVSLHKNKNGTKNYPYEENDNDFYWINEPNKEYFYVIPTEILVNKNHISNGQNIVTKNLNLTKNSKWLEQYKYNYTDDNINDMMNNLFI
jgi:hypothetical protein